MIVDQRNNRAILLHIRGESEGADVGLLLIPGIKLSVRLSAPNYPLTLAAPS